VIVRNLDLFGSTPGPTKYDPPLVVDPNRVFAGEAALQCFEPIAGRCREIAQEGRVVQLHQLAACDLGNVRREALGNPPLAMDRLGELAFGSS
jgi:hypothetical protein